VGGGRNIVYSLHLHRRGEQEDSILGLAGTAGSVFLRSSPRVRKKKPGGRGGTFNASSPPSRTTGGRGSLTVFLRRKGRVNRGGGKEAPIFFSFFLPQQRKTRQSTRGGERFRKGAGPTAPPWRGKEGGGRRGYSTPCGEKPPKKKEVFTHCRADRRGGGEGRLFSGASGRRKKGRGNKGRK